MATVKRPRSRRAEHAEATRRRVVDAATRLFTERGYAATSIEAVAIEADVSVETVYKRFGNKRALLRAALNLAVVEEAEPAAFVKEFLALPPLRAVQAEADQRRQVRMLAAFSRTRLERTAGLHAMLRTAVAGDAELKPFLTADHDLRRRSQRALVDILASTAPLRPGLSRTAAAETYSALANPDLYLLLTSEHGWTADRYESWLRDCLTRLLLKAP
jgi:AcrR family transcriptional regulator